jgi:hypothetical protein
MATSTGSRALDFALGIGAYAPQIEEPELPQEGGIASALPTPHKAGKLSPHAQDFEPIIQRAAQKYNVPPELLRGLIQQESSFNPRAVSSAGAMGLSQLMPGTAAQYGVKDAYDPEQNVMGGAHYLSDMMRRYNNDPQLALAAYNAGPGNVDKYLKHGVPLPSETQNYVPAVMGNVGQQMPAVPASQPVAEGMRVVTLTNGRELEVPAEMTDEQVLEQIRKSPSPEMSRLMPAREATIGGKSALVPFNMQDDEAMHHLVNQGDIPDPMAGKGGRGWGNLVSGFETSIGNMLTGMGKPEEAQRFYEAAKAGEYKMYESEVEAAKRKGMIPGLYAEAQQNLIYPGMEMLGQFAPAMMPGPAALKVGAMYPAARGEILHRAKEEGKEVSEADASLYGLPLAVVETLGLPVKGAGKLLGREAEEAAIKGMVERGAIEEAEKTALGSRAADLAQAYGTNVAKNVATMGAMEGIQRGAMGESMLPQSMEDVTSLIEPAAWFSLPHGAMEGLGARGAREEALARESAKREPVQAEIPERRPEAVEPEAVSEPEVTPPEVRTELQNIGEMYGRHVMESEARGEPPMSPEEFMAQHKTEPTIKEEIKDELAPGDIEAAPSSQIIQPSPFVRKVQERKNAQQEPSAGPIDGGGRAQPEVREEGRRPVEGGEGVEPSRQGIEAPEIIRQEVKAPEAEIKVEVPETEVKVEEPKGKPFPKTKAPEAVELPYVPKAQLDLLDREQVVAYHQQRGDVLKALSPRKVKALPERDQLDYHQYKGLDNAEIAKQMGYSGPEETLQKLEEHGLQNLEQELIKPISEERKKTIEAGIEDRAQYREPSEEALTAAEEKEFETYAKPEKGAQEEYVEPSEEDVLRDLPEFDFTAPDRELDYSKGEAAKEAHTPESLAKHLTDTYGARKPAVNVTTREQAGVDPSVKAFYDPATKKVHIVADNLGKKDNVHGLLKHEIGVHAQKLGVKDPEFQGILKHMQGMRDKGIQAVREAYSKVPEGTRPERVHEEALGYLVEHHPHIPLVRRFMSWLRRMAHKLTGHAGWLKPEDLSHMAHRILKKDYGVESRPERRDVQGEKLRSVRDDNLRAIRATGITKTEKQLTYRETAEEFAKVAKTAYGKRRGEYIDVTDPLTQALQKLDRFDKNLGKMRADLIAAEANQSVGLVAHALENGIPVINKSGSMMVTPGANLKHAVEFARSKEKGGEELLSYVLRANIGEYRLKEHAQDIQDLKRLAREILETKGAIKFHDKLNQGKERKLAEKALASKESAYKTIIRERNIDPETMEGREKLVDANMIALRDKLMKDHPWLKEATQEVYDAMDGLVDFQHQAGMIDKLTADKWKAAPYVPLYKALEDLEKDPTFSKLFPRSAESISQVKQIKGFKHSVNMLENLHKHYYGMMLPAVFNHVRRESMSQMIHLDALSRIADEPNLSYEKALRRATEAAEAKRAGPNTMKVLDNGEERHYKVQDPDLLQMFAFNRPEMAGWVNALRPVTAMQRTAFLKNPAFWGTQLFLDPLYANLTAGAKSLIHPGHALVNLMKIWAGKSEGAKALERHGVDIGYQAYAGKKSLSFEQTGEATQFHELFGKRSGFRKAMNMLDRVHNSIDEATRVSVYNAVKKDGKKLGLTGQDLEDYAVQRARTYMNFSARGRNQLLNEYRAVTAFTSAAINGADALMKNYKGYGLNEKEGAEVRRIFRNRLMAGMAAGMGLTLAQLNASNGKQDGDLFDQLTSIDTGLGFKVPMKWDVGALIYGLPKVFVMTTMLDATNPNSLTANQGVKAAWELIRKNMLPPIHLPDAINPAIEATFNFSTDEWDAIESAGAMRYAADARGRSNTFLGEFFGNLMGMSGKKADYVGRSYLGKFYDYTNAIADEYTGRMEGMPGADKKLEKAIIGPFYKDEDRVSGADRIYDADERAGQEVAAFNKFRDSNKEKFAEFKSDPERMAYRRAAPALRNARERLSAYEKQISQVMDSKLPKVAKETRIRQINEQKRKAIEQGNATVKRLLGDYAP